MRRIILISLLCVVVFLVSVIAHIPASFALSYLPKQVAQVEGVSGTIWNGQAQRVTAQGQQIGSLQWQVKPASLFMARVEADIRFGRGSAIDLRGRGTVGVGLSGPYAQQFVASVPASYVMSQLPMPIPIDALGQVELTMRDYQFDQPYCASAEGTIAWAAGELSTPVGPILLGPVIADISCQDSQWQVNGALQSAQVSGEFSATLESNNRYDSQGWFKPEAEFPSILSSQLSLVGQPDNQGRYQLSQKGRF
ncbi:type II secretion system protein N [Vibrio astriarenae]|uniref:type II secretion system protein N n=1 Tax=Vibrio astriarenae TaxID=1481923 RepID=UPI003736F1AA